MADVVINDALFLQRLNGLNTSLLTRAALWNEASSLQLAHGKRLENAPEDPFVVSMQVRALDDAPARAPSLPARAPRSTTAFRRSTTPKWPRWWLR